MKLLVITGQTATGKTNLALQKAQELNGEIINGDSRQIYTQLDIITGKDLPNNDFHLGQKLQEFSIGYYIYPPNIKLWLYDIVPPNHHFSSYDYVTCAEYVIKKLFEQQKTPIIVGGTYLYLQHLLYGFDIQVEPNWTLRNELAKKSVNQLQTLLQEKDTSTWDSLNESDRANPHRLIRKIEIAEAAITTTIKPTSLSERLGIPIELEMIGLRHSSKELLQQIITKRVEERIQHGAYQEVELLLKKFSPSDPGLNTIGYKQIMQYLQKEIAEDTLQQLWITKELQYAKRQYTFMKKDFQIKWLVI